ncbi:Hypothetical protein A7982_08214 [Minicystis rosea]|nr:Hypothetical protein A7982_08214 [Minicystis rosea]
MKGAQHSSSRRAATPSLFKAQIHAHEHCCGVVCVGAWCNSS